MIDENEVVSEHGLARLHLMHLHNIGRFHVQGSEVGRYLGAGGAPHTQPRDYDVCTSIQTFIVAFDPIV